MSWRKQKSSILTLFQLLENANLDSDFPYLKLGVAAVQHPNAKFGSQVEKLLASRIAVEQQLPYTARSYTNSISPNQKDVFIGTTIAGEPYTVSRDAWSKHLLAIGQSGAGKTTLFYNLMDQLQIPFWAFDLKQDYRHLIQDQDDLLVLPWTMLRFNPLKPPQGVPPRRWAQVFSEMFGHATALLSASKNHLMKKVIELYETYDLFDNVAPPYPSLHELQLLIERDPINYVRKIANYRDTVLNRLEAMTLAAGPVFSCSEGFPVEDLLTRNVVFEFDGLGNDLQNFLMEILLAYIYEYRLARNERGGDLRHVFFLDEGKRVFSVYKERQDAAGIPEIDELTAKMREFGEGLVVADQEATKLTDSIKANTYTKVLLATGDAKQFDEMVGSMHLTERQEELATKLGIGEAIVQTGNREPVPVRLHPYELAKDITDRELEEAQEGAWRDFPSTPRQTTPAFEEAIRNGGVDTEPDEEREQVGLSEDAERLLVDVVERPFEPLTSRYERFSSRERGNRAKDELVQKGAVIERHVRAREVRRKLLELTERGRELAEEITGSEVTRRGRGGIVHRFWQHRIKELFEQAGWTAKLELFDADVYATSGDTELAIEVAMENAPREIEHVRDHLDTFDAVWVVCRNEAVSDGLQERLMHEDVLMERVAFRLFREISAALIPPSD